MIIESMYDDIHDVMDTFVEFQNMAVVLQIARAKQFEHRLEKANKAIETTERIIAVSWVGRRVGESWTSWGGLRRARILSYPFATNYSLFSREIFVLGLISTNAPNCLRYIACATAKDFGQSHGQRCAAGWITSDLPRSRIFGCQKEVRIASAEDV